jgi:hypothetical protein
MAKRKTSTTPTKAAAPVKAAKASKVTVPVKATSAPRVRSNGADSGKVTIDRSRYNYVTHDVKTVSGRRAVDNADEVAEALRGLTLPEVRSILAENGIEWRWDHLNPGMQRMNAGNALRGKFKSQGKMVVLGKTVHNQNA